MKCLTTLAALFSILVLPSVAAAQGVSENPNSDYKYCHAWYYEPGPRPAWCTDVCGSPDAWCYFAGFYCYIELEIDGKPRLFKASFERDASDWFEEADLVDDDFDRLMDKAKQELYYACMDAGWGSGNCWPIADPTGDKPTCEWQDVYCAQVSPNPPYECFEFGY